MTARTAIDPAAGSGRRPRTWAGPGAGLGIVMLLVVACATSAPPSPGTTTGAPTTVAPTTATIRPPDVTQVTDTGAANGQAVFSPDGTEIAHASDRSGEWEAWITSADGTEARQVTDGLGPIGWPTWGDDGTTLWMYAPEDGGWGIVQVALATGVATPLATALGLEAGVLPAGDTFRPLLDPSGSRLLLDLADAGGGGHDLYVLDLAGGTATRLTSDPGYDSDARWSPDGTKVVFHSDRDDGDLHTQVFVLDLATNEVTRLTDGPATNGYPAWSPDGRRIVFTSELDGNRDLWLMGDTGQDPRRLTIHAGFDGDPVFTPDGDHVLFSTDRFGGRELALVAVPE